MGLPADLVPRDLGGLSPQGATRLFGQLLLCEARYANVRPEQITISQAISVPDGGLDALTSVSADTPADALIQRGETGYQIKTGIAFNPTSRSHVRKELVSKSESLAQQVRKLIATDGRYVLVCLEHDLNSAQRMQAKSLVLETIRAAHCNCSDHQVDVFGQTQILAYMQRYPSLCLGLGAPTDAAFLSIDEWSKHAHMANVFVASEEQQRIIQGIKEGLRGTTNHIRLLGEPGIGKTRLVLEALRDDDIRATVLYLAHGARFGQTALFRDLIREGNQYPLIVVLDELPERELTEVWPHLKQRSGALRLISIDHGPDRSRDSDIERLKAPTLSKDTIRAILALHVGDGHDLDRWVNICEGSPRVAQAVGENLAANPEDILKPPSTVPLWDRFLFGYSATESAEQKVIARVMRTIALFARMGFEPPVESEAQFVCSLIQEADSLMTWPLFQEIVQGLRDRRILQGDRTLSIVPWALHIYLWREHWRIHGSRFSASSVLQRMPESLHSWFGQMFCYGHGPEMASVTRELLRVDGLFGNTEFLRSATGSSLISSLAEADPEGCLRLLEQTIGAWSKSDLLSFSENRQNIVWALEKIAVWRATCAGALRLLARLAAAESSNYSNNATGIFVDLFRIGPGWAATEAPPAERIAVLREGLASTDLDVRRLSLKAAEAALDFSYRGFRIVGAEYQGLKEPAKFWSPATYGEMWAAMDEYWKCLLAESAGWEPSWRGDRNKIIVEAALERISMENRMQSALEAISRVAEDKDTDMRSLHRALQSWIQRHKEDEANRARFELRRIQARTVRIRRHEARFRRYVLDVSWDEWDGLRHEGETHKERPKILLRALAARAARRDEVFAELLPLMGAGSETQALFEFGRALAKHDTASKRFDALIEAWRETSSSQCVGGYVHFLKSQYPDRYNALIHRLLAAAPTAPLAIELLARCGIDEDLMEVWVSAACKGFVSPTRFEILGWGQMWKSVSKDQLHRVFALMNQDIGKPSTEALLQLLNYVGREDWPPAELVFDALSRGLKYFEHHASSGHYWHDVAEAFIELHPKYRIPLLDSSLDAMRRDYSLSYDHYVAPLAAEICARAPLEAWEVVTSHLLSAQPKWRGDVLNWLRGGHPGFKEEKVKAAIASFQTEVVMGWVSDAPEWRAAVIAHCAPRTLDDEFGGQLTRRILADYGEIDGVRSGISAIFGSGGWTGPESAYLRSRRERFRKWLAQGFEPAVQAWIELELQYLDPRIERAEIEEERERWNRPASP